MSYFARQKAVVALRPFLPVVANEHDERHSVHVAAINSRVQRSRLLVVHGVKVGAHFKPALGQLQLHCVRFIASRVSARARKRNSARVMIDEKPHVGKVRVVKRAPFDDFVILAVERVNHSNFFTIHGRKPGNDMPGFAFVLASGAKFSVETALQVVVILFVRHRLHPRCLCRQVYCCCFRPAESCTPAPRLAPARSVTAGSRAAPAPRLS